MGSVLSLITVKTSARALSLFLVMATIIQQATGQSATAQVAVTVTVSRDPTSGFVTFDQSGSFVEPSGTNNLVSATTASRFTRTTIPGIFSDFGFIAPGSTIEYTFVQQSSYNADLSCLRNTIVGLDLSPSIPTLVLFVRSQFPSTIIVARDDTSGGPASIEGMGTTATSVSMEFLGLNECTVCFFEYDTDNDLSNGFEAAIVWNVGSNDGSACPTPAPSSQPSASSWPSSEPSASSAPSNQPSNSPTFCLKKSKTKSPGRKSKSSGKRSGGMMMTKSPVQTCFETAFPTPATKIVGKGKKSLRKL